MKVIHTSMIFENTLPQLKSLHSFFPFLCELDNGMILASHTMGEAFESVDMTSYISTSRDGGVNWEYPAYMFNKKNQNVLTSDCCKITKLKGGKIIALGYEFIRENIDFPIGNPKTGGLLQDNVFFSFSDDNGHNWSDRKEIKCIWGKHVEASAPITVLKDGSFAAPITGFPDWEGNMTEKMCGRLLRSYDDGETWSDDVICMEFSDKNITCYEQRMCQIENGNIIVIGWNEDLDKDSNLNNHYTISVDNGKSFSAPKDTRINGQASSVCSIGGNKVLALHSMRKNCKRPGIYAYIVDLSDGNWNITEEIILWEPKSPVIKSENMSEVFAYLKFGQPGAILLKDKDALVCFWVFEDGQYKTISQRIQI